MTTHKDHLVIHKEPSLNTGIVTHYLVNTYFDYVQTHYFLTRKDAETFVFYYKESDTNLGLQSRGSLTWTN